MNDGPGGYLSHRDMWPIQRELGAAEARGLALEREVHTLSAHVTGLSAQVTTQLGGLRAEILTVSDRQQHTVQREIADVMATIRSEQANQRIMLAIVAVAALGGPAVLKLLGIG